MRRVGRTELLLVEGAVPHYGEMVALGREISRLMVREYGSDFFVEKLADPYWLSCLSCVLGFEWDTSGQTTVTLMALKEALSDGALGVLVAGGKGGAMRDTPRELMEASRSLKREDLARGIINASRFSCRVDNNALQDSYNVYFHCVVLSSSGSAAIINQGMNTERRLARRYQWLGSDLRVEEPHSAISSHAKEEAVLDLTSVESRGCRRCILDILSDSPVSSIQSDLLRVQNMLSGQSTIDGGPPLAPHRIPTHLRPPKKLSERSLKRAKKRAESFEALLVCEGVGASTLRGLAYISELIYGGRASWRDPARYAFAFGTKSGRPYPVDRRGMMEAAEVLRRVVESKDTKQSQIMLRRLRALISGLEA